MKKFIILAILTAVVVSGVYVFMAFKSSAATLDELTINAVIMSEDSVKINGEFVSSASVYMGNAYKVDGDSLYVEVRRGVASIFNRNGQFSFSLKFAPGQITNVYLVSGEAKSLLWSK